MARLGIVRGLSDRSAKTEISARQSGTGWVQQLRQGKLLPHLPARIPDFFC